MSESKQAVFISYASDDSAAALGICEALRAVNIEVWFDQTELRGGDAWDARIRGQIKTCALFLVVVSQNASAREEGYFRLEWKLAIDRSHLMSQARTFILPVAIDRTPESSGSLPDRFREVQWLRLPQGEATPAFIDRVKQLLSRIAATEVAAPEQASPARVSDARRRTTRRTMVGVAATLLMLVAAAALKHLMSPVQQTASPASAASSSAVPMPAFKPPVHSVAVMPFANLSGDVSQEYFSDGLSDEILDSFSRLAGLQVAARSSSFSFKGNPGTVAEIARKLNVGALLEGSVRRAGNKVRISAQLVDAVTGFELWSQTYDRELKDILGLQTEIATAVTRSLQVKLTQNLAEVIEAGGTRNPEALDAYFKARGFAQHGAQKELEQALKYLNEAIRADPNYAEAFVDRSSVESNLAGSYDPIERIRGRRAEARKDAEQAIKLAPRMAGAYARYADLLIESVFDFRGAQQQFSKAAELAPNDEHVMASRARFESLLGHHDEAVALSRRLIELNPGSGPDYYDAAIALLYAGEVDEALRDAEHTQSLGTDFGLQPQCGALIRQHRYEQVVATCPESDDPVIQTDRTVALHALNRPEEARLMLEKLLKDNGESAAYQYAEIYSQNGEANTALNWLEKAYELRDSGLVTLKQDFLLDPIRKEPRFQAVLRKMDFPP